MKKEGFGTAPVFFTAISTILGAILFLRFGWAVGSIGFWGVIGIVLLGHLVTIPTALAISEIATNKRVEGGGEYFIISRSFGLNIGATIGMALFLSQAISVAFYVIAFTEAFSVFFDWVNNTYGWHLPRQVISLPALLGLSVLILKKGASMGVKTLYVVIAILAVSLVLFFIGKTEYQQATDFSFFSNGIRNGNQFFLVFAVVFPAFTGMTAGVGLSGELRNPSRSIPLGTSLATVFGMIIYFFIVWKLSISASEEDLLGNQLIMSNIAWGGSIIIPLGLAASTISSAIGSILVAPRTLQALAKDKSFPSKKVNEFLKASKGDGSDEPVNATLVTCFIAFFFVLLGDVNAVAEIISMFFMVTYGALCLISFLNHFGSSPSYRPSFRSKWYVSLAGFLVSVWVMFMINPMYAFLATIFISLLYVMINTYHKKRKGLETIFSNALFQLNRNMQVYMQRTRKRKDSSEWRPSAICISENSFGRDAAFNLLNWISYKYGFGTYIHLLKGYFSKSTSEDAKNDLQRLIGRFTTISNHVYLDTMISPSYTSAIAQVIQLHGISGMENNMVVLEFEKAHIENIEPIIENFPLIHSGGFDVCILGSSPNAIKYMNGIHVWIKATDEANANLMIMLSYIILGHPEWEKSNIKIFEICKVGQEESVQKDMAKLVEEGRLPINSKNIEIITEQSDVNPKDLINERSMQAGLTLIGFREEHLKHAGKDIFTGYEKLGAVLFVNSHKQIKIS